MTFGSTFGRVFSPTFQPKSQAKKAGGGWWDLDGTITSCVAAYQAKGAASYAASKVNLVNGGTNDLTDGTAYPSWSAGNGWSYVAANKECVYTPSFLSRTLAISYDIPAQVNGNYPSMMMKKGSAFSAYRIRITTGSGNSVFDANTWTQNYYYNGSYWIDGTVTLDLSEDTRQTIVAVAASDITQQYQFGCTQYGLTGNICAVAFYDDALTQSQAASLATAMNSL